MAWKNYICLVNVTTTTTILEDGSKIITHNCHIYRATLMPQTKKKGAVIQSWAFSLARVAGHKDRISSKKHMASLCFKTLESRRSGIQKFFSELEIFQVLSKKMSRWSRVLCKSGCQKKGRPVDLRNHEKSNFIK